MALNTVAGRHNVVVRLQHLVDGLLALARAEGRHDRRVGVDVAATARERAEVWRPLAEEMGISMTVTTPTTAIAVAVPGAVEQMVDNFVDNALAVVTGGGAVEIDVLLDADGAVELHVRDTGPGMPANYLEHAFDRFWRASGTGTGSGLELATVAQLARASGATAAATNRRQGGLDATVTFARGGTAEEPDRARSEW